MEKSEARRRHIYGYLAVILAVIAVIVIFWPASPEQRYWSKRVWHITPDQLISVEQARVESEKIIQEAKEEVASGRMNNAKWVELQRRATYLRKFANPEPTNSNSIPAAMAVQWSLNPYLAFRAEYFGRKGAGRGVDFRKLLEVDSENMRLENFEPYTDESNANSVALRYVMCYLLTVPLGALIHALLLVWSDGRKTLHALVEAFMNRSARMMFYPVTIPFALMFSDRYENYRQNLRRLVRLVGYATAGCVSLFCGGNAMAQTFKKSNDKKSSGGYTLQLDSRIGASIEGPPPYLQQRQTLNSRKWVAEAVTIFTPKTRSWYNEVGGGRRFVKGSTAFNLVGFISNDSSGTRKVIVGGQYFRSSPVVTVAVPVIRFEKTIGGPTAVAVAANPIIRFGRSGLRSRLAISPDVLVRKTIGRSLSWVVGAGFAVFPRAGKGDRIEGAVLRNSAGQWQLRGRYVINFAF